MPRPVFRATSFNPILHDACTKAKSDDYFLPVIEGRRGRSTAWLKPWRFAHSDEQLSTAQLIQCRVRSPTSINSAKRSLGLLPEAWATLTAQGDDGGPSTGSGGGSGELSSREEVEGGENGSRVAHGGLRGA
jgi:hypothetical protein